MIARRPVLSLFVLALILLAATAWQNRQHLAAFPGIISAYTAKEYSSCRYVMGNPAFLARSVAYLGLGIAPRELPF